MPVRLLLLLLLLLLLAAGVPMACSRLVFGRHRPVKELGDAPKLSVAPLCDPRPQARPHPHPSQLTEHFVEMLFIESGIMS
jgi:hypothetical protein